MPLKNSCKHPCTEVYMTYYHLKVTHCCYIFYHYIHAHLDNYTKLTCNIISHIENAITHTHTDGHNARARAHTHTSSGNLPPSRSKCPTTPLFSTLCLFFEFPVTFLHHPVHELLSRPSSSSLSFHPSFHYLPL